MTTSKKFIAIFVMFMILICSVIALVACKDNKNNDQYFDVTYVYGNGQKNSTISVKSGELATQPRNPTYEGHTFQGWFRDGATVKYDFSTPVTESFTLTAHWESSSIDPPPVTSTEIRLNWRNTDAASFVFEYDAPRSAKAGDVIKFGISTSPYYSIPADGALIVTASGVEIIRETELPDEGKEFTYTVPQDSTTILFEINGLQRDSGAISGSGTSADPYVIANNAQFKTFSDAINNVSDTRYNSAYISLQSDLNFKGEQLEPIGADLSYTYFSGVFYGNGHTISNFTLDTSSGIIGLFGYVAQAVIADVNVQDVIYSVDVNNLKNYVVGGIVAYNIGSDIVGCSVKANFNVNLMVSGPIVYVGGIVGFAQGYGTDYTATVAYCSVEGNITSSGWEPLYSVGGIAGALHGTAESAPAYVTNCAYVGNISGVGSADTSGGIVGYLRAYTAVANCYAQGSVTSQKSSGGIVGFAENETAVTFSYAATNILSYDDMDDVNTVSGDVVGNYYKDGELLKGLPLVSVDGKEVLVYKSYVVDGGKIGGVDVSDFGAVKALLGWADSDWDFNNGRPVVKPEGEAEVKFDVTFQFANSVTVGGKSSDVINVEGGYIPTYWAQDGSGKNTFLADNGYVSYGFYLDEQHTRRVPSAMPLTHDMTIYVAFADYSAVAGTYYAVVQIRNNTEFSRYDVTLTFNELGRMTMVYDGMVSYNMYVYDGEKIYIRDAYFVNLGYYSQDRSTNLNTDFYATFNLDGTLTICDNYFFTSDADMQHPITAYRRNAVMGEWYDQSNAVYSFNADGSGTSSTQGQFTYTYVQGIVTITIGDKTIVAILEEGDDHMVNLDGEAVFSLTKFDEFTGTWEAEYGLGFSVTFDGKGNVTIGEGQYHYEINGGELKFDNGKQYTAHFNADGLLVLTNGDETLTLGREGSYIGLWVETWYNYSVRLYGIGRDGYGHALDSRGFDLTYTSRWDDLYGAESYYLNFYYRTVWYGDGYEQQPTPESDEKDLGKGSLLYLSMYTPESGAILDDYNMVYVDIFEGVWNATNGESLKFNGYGGYNINMPYGGSTWLAIGQVAVTSADGETQTVRYEFDRNTRVATFTVNGEAWTANYTSDGLTVTVNSGSAKTYLAPDEYAGFTFQSEDGSVLSFNGKSNVGLGIATLINDGQTSTYDYTIEGDIVTLKQDGTTVYTASVNIQTYMLDLVDTGNSTISFGLYSPMFGKTYHLSVDSLSFELHGVFDLRGIATATFAGYEVRLEMYADNAVAVYFGSYIEYYIVCVNDNNVALFDSYQQLIGMLTVLDDWGGTYVADNGDTLYIDGRGLVYGYYPTARLTTSEGTITYVYEIQQDGTIVLSININDEWIPYYVVSRVDSQGATAFVSENGTTLYITEIS
ncbi:MAG: InlB B-repeat-containing protein [Clostridiales bacterium]|nr:InlB B-repeat-containing protein [Clostridiales bacterium]